MIIFSSNQVFEFSGCVDDTDSIRIVAELIVKGIRPYGWRFVEEGLFFDYHRNDLNNCILTEDNNVEYIISIMNLYFNSSIYKEAVKKIVAYDGGDGSRKNGWIASYFDEAYDNKGLLIKPFKCFYHK